MLNSPDYPEAHYRDQAVLNIQGSTCFCLPRAGIKGFRHHSWINIDFFYYLLIFQIKLYAPFCRSYSYSPITLPQQALKFQFFSNIPSSLSISLVIFLDLDTIYYKNSTFYVVHTVYFNFHDSF